MSLLLRIRISIRFIRNTRVRQRHSTGNECIHIAFNGAQGYIQADVKAVCLTIRGCPADVHAALEQSAAANRRSLNAETITWLSRQAASHSLRATEHELQRRMQTLEKEWRTRMTVFERESLVKAGRL